MQFTELLVSHGRDYAKENEKDFARDIVRFVRNSRLLQILSAFGVDVSRLETSLNWLALECHPEDVPDFKPDLVAIRASLERLEIALALGVTGGGAAEPLPACRPLPCLIVTTATTLAKIERPKTL
jgi:hypothetical protein